METNHSILKPCPFCGKSAKLIRLDQSISNFVVGCDNRLCWIEPRTGSFDAKAEAENAWNTRIIEVTE